MSVYLCFYFSPFYIFRARAVAGGNVQFGKLCVFLLFPLFWGCCAGIVSETSPLDGANIEGTVLERERGKIAKGN